MSSIIGSQLGSYRITALLGKGGMGEVYRASDLKLGRSVAVKLLPALFDQDPERIGRFEREARMLAALSHPNIASIHGLEVSAGRNFLVMELVEGETLDEWIRRGPIPIEEALKIALQICEALEAAHEKNIVHRDLKPANVKVTPEGKVKVLDFGLAKALAAPSSSMSLSNSPTLSVAATNAGMILGTAAYMSPEQAKGKDADKRSDVWSFGVVLFEMLTGQSPFAGETVIEVLGAVIKADPEWKALPATLSPNVRQMFRRCLQKDPARRLRDIGEARFQIEEAIAVQPATEAVTAHGKPKPFERLVWTAGVVLALAVGAVVSAMYLRSTLKVSQPEARFEIPVPPGSAFSIAISRDGRNVVYAADAAGTPMLWVRPINSLQGRALPGTQNGTHPFWSPDGRFVAYTADGKLMKTDITSGTAQTITTVSGTRSLGTWNVNDVILFGFGRSVMLKVSAAGGAATRALDPDATVVDTEQLFPSFLPDGDHFLFFGGKNIYVGSIASRKTKRLMASDSMGLYAAGFILFLRGGTLIAQPFDASRLELTGDPTPVVENVALEVFSGRAGFAASENGTLIYKPDVAGRGTVRLNWLNRKGERLESIAPPAAYSGPSLSPDGKQVAVRRHEQTGGDILMMDSSGGKTTNLTSNAQEENASPVWSPDGNSIVFGAQRGSTFGLYVKSTNGVGEERLLLESPVPLAPMSWSGDNIAYMVSSPGTGWDIWLLSLANFKATPLLNKKFDEGFPQLSPDFRWIAYSSSQNGKPEIWVESFPPGRGRWQISQAGGRYVWWGREGKELLYIDVEGNSGDVRFSSGKMFSVDITAADKVFKHSTPRVLFELVYAGGPSMGRINYQIPVAVSSDGEQFLVRQRDMELGLGQPTTINVIMNWTAAIQKH